jgi:Ni/Co efflux regulator RcnB
MLGPLKGFGAITNLVGIGTFAMTTTKSLLVATLLSTFAAMSFAQVPAAPEAPNQVHQQRHHHKHHGHHHHNHRHAHEAHVGK